MKQLGPVRAPRKHASQREYACFRGDTARAMLPWTIRESRHPRRPRIVCSQEGFAAFGAFSVSFTCTGAAHLALTASLSAAIASPLFVDAHRLLSPRRLR